MKTVLDLIEEFAILNDAKVLRGGQLPSEVERRWRELKSFYDLLMAPSSVCPRAVSRQCSADDITRRITTRNRLRVPVELDIFFRRDGEFNTGKVVNLSRGGMFLSSGSIAPVRSQLQLFVYRKSSNESVLEADAEVAWTTTKGFPAASIPQGMGVSLLGADTALVRCLDQMVVSTLEQRLSGVDTNALAPEFVTREQLVL